jgi:hypothetical protein
MKADTKIYSDFIKRNKVKSTKNQFSFYDENNNLIVYSLSLDDDGLWYAEQNDKCETKKSAIYWHIKNNHETENGKIVK